MSQAQPELKAEAGESCDWRPDSPEPELDDLAHQHIDKPNVPEHREVCDWRVDSPEP
jgi:hypothetical protein